ncbi:LptF/LptG family permease [Paracrocinitomix mangrovi]|uniref:LptF/LptG family permease n=1 Tax=Paracrocinitomix mangrovi TaxID=2862509 RepID=UPI001EDC6660|nr:LptF/LptG family permease [Paracrocinitomix mangrovi]
MAFLIMQFLWKYVDDLIGKGLDYGVLFKLLFYVSATLIPLAVPLAVLFSSIMTFGNLAEQNELTALKSAGLSLRRIMRPMFIFVLALSLGAFYFTNYLLPIANYKSRTIIYDIQEKKPTFGITPGIFYNDIDNYSIRVDKKNDETGELFGILIYEYNDIAAGKTIIADKGEMLKSENDRFLLLKLEDGAIYEEMKPAQIQKDKYPFQKTFFEETIIKFDLSGFQMQQTNEELFKRDYEMLNFVQLGQTIDSLSSAYDTSLTDFGNVMTQKMVIYNSAILPIDSTQLDTLEDEHLFGPAVIDTIIKIDNLHNAEMDAALATVQGELRSRKEMLLGQMNYMEAQQMNITQFKAAYHKKFTLSVAILILFFIGAPLGAIIKRGGLGAPLVFAVLFFLLYYVTTIMGENMVDSNLITPWKGMWMSTFILLPLGAFLTYKATNDSSLFDLETYKKLIKLILSPFKKRKNEDSSAMS